MKQQIKDELIKTIRARLGCVKIFNDNNLSNIYSDEEIDSFINCANSEVYALTSQKLSESKEEFPKCLALVVDFAVIVALASKALIEKGREFVISDNGIGSSSPNVSEILNDQYKFEYQMFMEKIRIFNG